LKGCRGGGQKGKRKEGGNKKRGNNKTIPNVSAENAKEKKKRRPQSLSFKKRKLPKGKLKIHRIRLRGGMSAGSQWAADPIYQILKTRGKKREKIPLSAVVGEETECLQRKQGVLLNAKFTPWGHPGEKKRK